MIFEHKYQEVRHEMAQFTSDMVNHDGVIE